MSNFLQNLLNAVNKDQSTMQWMQISDTNATMMDARMEEQTYTLWNTQLNADAAAVQSAVSGGGSDESNNVAAANAKYSSDSSISQSAENSADSTTQAAQQAVGQDGTNLQSQAQLAQALNTISSNLASLIGHAYS
jgi:hypothetical protein